MTIQPADERKTTNKNKWFIIAAVALVAINVCLCGLFLTLVVLVGRPVLCGTAGDTAVQTITPFVAPTRLPSTVPSGTLILVPTSTQPPSPTPVTKFTVVPTPPRQQSPGVIPKGPPTGGAKPTATLCPGCAIGPAVR